MSRSMRGAAMMVVAGLLALACDHASSAGKGSLVVRWQVKGNTCTQAKIVGVQVSLLYDDTVVASQEATCGVGEAVFDDVDTGAYEVRVDGLDADGATTYSATAVGIAVSAGEPSPSGTLELEKVGSGLSLSWYFEKNGLCGFHGIVYVDVTVWYDQLELHHQVYGCDPLADPESTLPVGDVPGVKVLGLQVPEVDVVLFGLDRDGSRRFSGERHVQLQDGRVVNIGVPLTECEGPCG